MHPSPRARKEKDNPKQKTNRTTLFALPQHLFFKNYHTNTHTKTHPQTPIESPENTDRKELLHLI
jgi:hypothetical protein